MKLLITKPNVQAANSTWPFGKSTDNTGSGNGFPLNSETLEDYHQFFEKLFFESGLTANGLPDNATNGFQLWQALRVLVPLRTKIIEIGTWNMDSTASVSIAHGLTDFRKIRTISAYINDDDNLLSAFLIGDEGSVGLIDATNVVLARNTGGAFDGASFNNTAVNRGYLTIQYVD